MLFAAIAAGDEAAFREVFHTYNSRLFPFIFSLVKSEADAREIIQEVFLKVWLSRDTLREIVNPGGWLHTVASNAVYDWLRRRARYELSLKNMLAENAADHEDPLLRLDSRYFQELIEEAVRKLPERRQQIFRLSKIEGYTRREIADQMNISENTVRNQLAEAIDFIRQHLRGRASCYMPAIFLLLDIF